MSAGDLSLTAIQPPQSVNSSIATTPQNDKLLFPIKSNIDSLTEVIKNVLLFAEGNDIEHSQWECGRYCPTPTIIEAAMALYNRHSVDDISRSDASAINLSQTSKVISDIILYPFTVVNRIWGENSVDSVKLLYQKPMDSVV